MSDTTELNMDTSTDQNIDSMISEEPHHIDSMMTEEPNHIMTTDDYWLYYFRTDNFTEYEDDNKIEADPNKKPPVFNGANLSPFNFGSNADTNTESTDTDPTDSTDEWIDWSPPPRLNSDLCK